ncbi:helix-turn-helix domain-containing protein [Nostoc punctiforme UO1]|uniref:helix-turn-helix domain-containing protein n=1 Tax=Nostoc punctiforme TaxID=272131 RepID=UPI003098DAE7
MRKISAIARKTYGQKLQEAAEKLGVSLRTVQRLAKNWEQDYLVGLIQRGRTDKGQYARHTSV